MSPTYTQPYSTLCISSPTESKWLLGAARPMPQTPLCSQHLPPVPGWAERRREAAETPMGCGHSTSCPLTFHLTRGWICAGGWEMGTHQVTTTSLHAKGKFPSLVFPLFLRVRQDLKPKPAVLSCTGAQNCIFFSSLWPQFFPVQ